MIGGGGWRLADKNRLWRRLHRLGQNHRRRRLAIGGFALYLLGLDTHVWLDVVSRAKYNTVQCRVHLEAK